MANLLIVDDDADVADLLSMLLERASHRVRIAHNGVEGLELIRADAPDLIVLDVEMPIMGGPLLAMKLLIHDCGLERIPIILCSGSVGLDAIAREVGTPYFIGKPFDPGAFDVLLNRALHEHLPPQRASGQIATP